MRKGKLSDHGPQQIHVDAAVRSLEEELVSSEFIEKLSLDDVLPPRDQIEHANEAVIRGVATEEPNFEAGVGDVMVRVYLDGNLSPNDPYYVNETKEQKIILVVVNISHPHWHMLDGENAILNFLRHCVYDAIAEDRAAKKQRLDSDTVKLLKDQYLRVPFEILQSHEQE